MIKDMIVRLGALSQELRSKPLEKGVSTTTTTSNLRRAIGEVFQGSSLTDVEIDDGEEYEGAVYATLHFKDTSAVYGSMLIVYDAHIGWSAVGGCDLGLVCVAYDGGVCESAGCFAVYPEFTYFMETLATLDEEEFFSDGNNGVPLDSAGRQLLDSIRQIGRELLVE
jgi:hypothetical protein